MNANNAPVSLCQYRFYVTTISCYDPSTIETPRSAPFFAGCRSKSTRINHFYFCVDADVSPTAFERGFTASWSCRARTIATTLFMHRLYSLTLSSSRH
ncbi:hypothetical protein BAUCODRAFT_339921 [Baudoinia panamericana UAMH 10762]|uniref:Uncharacterized protein n=1 Tax=Baudoinia panamericana (strain UAMH 10762) TaxID=717646 RepID=M2N665_BAUPA|nr:uncharacterized protein BAUCODRAFT_339921 [Baudoinia panamericana UAMH 10762]EMC99533.1 hypothetical protein BAUCODRAFT_339921 [Baudoinia panamericana UAMH 10762]